MSADIQHQHKKNQLRRYRRQRNLKLVEVAKLIGHTTPSHLSHWEHGRKQPSLDNALKLSAVLKCPVEILFFDRFDEIRRQLRDKRKD